ALAGDAARLLGGVVPPTQPDGQILRVERDPQVSPDELGQPGGGPQVGGEAVQGGALGQPAEDDLLLGVRQLTGPAWGGVSRQAGPGPAGPRLPRPAEAGHGGRRRARRPPRQRPGRPAEAGRRGRGGAEERTRRAAAGGAARLGAGRPDRLNEKERNRESEEA